MRFFVNRGRRATPVGSDYLCTDDYGSAVFACRFTDRPVRCDGSERISGNIVPQANVCYVALRGTEPAEAESRRLFHESEANCNMCAYFRRLPYDKREFSISGVFYGTCAAGKKDGLFPVAPDDWAGMPCWRARVSPQPT